MHFMNQPRCQETPTSALNFFFPLYLIALREFCGRAVCIIPPYKSVTKEVEERKNREGSCKLWALSVTEQEMTE